MVKSNATAMAKRRKVSVDPELLRELEDLERRMRETDRRIEVTIERAREAQMMLRELARRYR